MQEKVMTLEGDVEAIFRRTGGRRSNTDAEPEPFMTMTDIQVLRTRCLWSCLRELCVTCNRKRFIRTFYVCLFYSCNGVRLSHCDHTVHITLLGGVAVRALDL